MKNIMIWTIISFTFLVSSLTVGLATRSRHSANPILTDTVALTENTSSTIQVRTTHGCGKYDPFNHNDEAYKDYLRSKQGIPNDMPLEEAVMHFNKKSLCSDIGKIQPSLTKEEVLAAARDALIAHRKKLHPLVIEAFEKLSKEQIIAKGSLIDVDLGYQHPDYDINCWNIYFFAGLDKHPKVPHPETDSKSENSYLIRKHFISSKPSKAPNLAK